MKNTIKAIAALIISATMLSITACGNTDNTSSAAPKATTTASSTEASATTTTEATLTSRSEETSLSATTTSSTTSASTSSGKSSTTTKGGSTAKANSSKASNGGTVNNQSYSHNTSNNGSGNNSYSNGNNNSYQPQQTERQTERQTQRQTTTTTRQTTTTAKKTQAPKPKPTTTTTAKPKANLTQSDIDRLQKELQAYSNELARPRVEKIYAQFGYSSVDEFLADTADINLDTASWMTGDNVYAHEKYADVLQSLKEEIQDEYSYYDEHNLTQSIIIIQAGTDYYGHSCWNTYLLRA